MQPKTQDRLIDSSYLDVPLSVVEQFYKKRGRTLLATWLGSDPFDFWAGRFYVGFFGVLSTFFAFLGTIFYLYAGLVRPGTLNLIAARIDPPPPEAGLAFQGPGQPGFWWQIICLCATFAFLSWAMREIDICRKLRMGYHVPITYLAVVSSWITLQYIRPIAMGAWSNGFTLGITAHLDWVSNVGYQYFNFFYNPFHALAISLFFGTTMLLAMHGSAILSAIRKPPMEVENVDSFWRDIVGYSIGEIGIHRLGFWAAIGAVLFANLCIGLSGPLVGSWSAFWTFWDRIPLWSGAGAMAFVNRGHADEYVPHLPKDMRGRWGRPFNVPIVGRLFGSGQFGPIYLGMWGTISVIAFVITVMIILLSYLVQVNFNPLLFMREFAVLSVDPPAATYGLRIAPWYQGGNWVVATLFLHVSVLAWLARVWNRARDNELKPSLAKAFSAAVFLYLVIYLIRPLLLGAWSEAPGHGLKAHLDWVNNVSVRYGNFYYNPFHMLSIFFLLGSTMLLGMHGATIVAVAPYKGEAELEEIELERSGTHRAQLFWRWVMGFNANAQSIHLWAFWFAVFAVVTGGIGLLLSGPVIPNWYEWAKTAGIVSNGIPNR